VHVPTLNRDSASKVVCWLDLQRIRSGADRVPLGQQTLLSSADEVDGTGRFDFEVTATKVR